MTFTETPLTGAFVVELQERRDFRGFFARAFCQEEFEQKGLSRAIAQMNFAYTEKKGTMRGIHFQVPPAAEAKYIRCVRGSIYDAIIDLRPHSNTYRQAYGTVLSAENRKALFIPKGFGHGYLSLEDNSETLYTADEFYAPGLESGYRYDDPTFSIDWPIPIEHITDKDKSWPLFAPEATK